MSKYFSKLVQDISILVGFRNFN